MFLKKKKTKIHYRICKLIIRFYLVIQLTSTTESSFYADASKIKYIYFATTTEMHVNWPENKCSTHFIDCKNHFIRPFASNFANYCDHSKFSLVLVLLIVWSAIESQVIPSFNHFFFLFRNNVKWSSSDLFRNII